MNSESENLRGNKNFENAERKNNFKFEKVWQENSLNWNQTKSIINRNKKINSIHVD